MALGAKERWWTGLTKYQWLVLLVAWLGWVFDIADSAIFNLTKGSIVKEMLGGDAAYKLHGAAVEGQIQMVFIIGWAIGGLLFGVLADRWGRVRTMTLTILLYCVFTGLTALCRTPEQVAAIRFLTALGIGGEWAAGASLVAEVFPDRARAGAAALLQTAAAIGPVLAALANQAFAGQSWRWLFVVGVAPAILTVVIRAKVKEPERWVTTVERKRGSWVEPLRALFANSRWRKNALLAMVIGLVGIAGAGNLSFWVPNLSDEASRSLGQKVMDEHRSYITYTMHIGTLLGVLVFPWICERLGRRAAFFAFFAACPLSLWLVLSGKPSFELLIVAVPFLAFFAIGLSAGYGLWLPELFPTAHRATGCSLAYNTARIGQAPWPWVTGEIIGKSHGNVARGVLVAGAMYLVGLVALPFAPETKGKPLPEE